MLKCFLWGSILAGLLAGCGLELSPDLDVDGAIVVGVPDEGAPFFYKDDNGEIAGIYADMARDLGLYLNRGVELRVLKASQQTTAVLSGGVDLTLLTVTQSEADETGLGLSDPFAWRSLAFLTGAESVLDDVEELNVEGRVVVVIDGSRGMQFVRTALPAATVKVVETEAEALRAVKAGEAEAFVQEALEIFNAVDDRTDPFRAVLAPIRRAGIRFGTAPDHVALLEAVNDFLFDYREIGGFERLEDRYFPEAREAFEVQDADFLFDPPERAVIEDTEAGAFSLD